MLKKQAYTTMLKYKLINISKLYTNLQNKKNETSLDKCGSFDNFIL